MRITVECGRVGSRSVVRHPVSAGNSIILVGQFAPWSCRPERLAKEGVFSLDDLTDPTNVLITAEYVQFTLPWLQFAVDPQRVQLATDESPHIRVHDFALSFLATLGPAPVAALGINRYSHYKCDSIEEWHKIGDRFAPKKPWGTFMDGEGPLKPGLRSILFEKPRREPKPGFTRVKLEPSILASPGIFIEVNDHYELLDQGTPDVGEVAAEIIHSRWSISEAVQTQIAESVMVA